MRQRCLSCQRPLEAGKGPYIFLRLVAKSHPNIVQTTGHLLSGSAKQINVKVIELGADIIVEHTNGSHDFFRLVVKTLPSIVVWGARHGTRNRLQQVGRNGSYRELAVSHYTQLLYPHRPQAQELQGAGMLVISVIWHGLTRVSAANKAKAPRSAVGGRRLGGVSSASPPPAAASTMRRFLGVAGGVSKPTVTAKGL